MRFTELICRLARDRFQDTARLGVRLSPVDLRPEEAAELADVARAVIGPLVHVAVAAPGAPAVDEPRRCVSAGERAAEQATAWRNSIDPEAGERILYVSVERQGKAGGLLDTLEEIGERSLRAEFSAWCGGEQGDLPPELAAALHRIDVTDRVPARALCEFSEAVRRAEGEDARWEAASRSLPMLSLAVDTNLRADIEGRLKANAQLVREAATAEARGRSKLTPAAQEKRRAINAAIAEEGGAAAEALAQVDLGGLSTVQLQVKRSSRSKPKGRPSAPAKRAPKPKRSRRKPTTEATLPRKGTHAATATKREDAARQAPIRVALGESIDSAKAGVARAREAGPGAAGSPGVGAVSGGHTGSAAVGEAPPRGEPAPSSTGEAPAVWTEAMQRREYGTVTARLPKGLATLLEVQLRQPAAAVRWALPRGPLAPVLNRLPKHTPDPALDALAPQDAGGSWPGALVAYLEAREALVGPLLDASSRLDLLARLIRAPLLALGEPLLRERVEVFVGAAAALASAAVEAGDPEVARRALAAETLTIEDEERGEVLVILSPLHPLWLGQVVARYRVMATAGELGSAERRLLVRSLSQVHAAPELWPTTTGGRLQQSSQVAGLVTYASRAAAVSDAALEDVGRGLLSRLVELHPPALLGARVVVEGDAPRGLLRGLSAAAEELHEATPPLQRLTLFATGHAAAGLAAEGGGERTELRPLPVGEGSRAALRPHLVISVAGAAVAETDTGEGHVAPTATHPTLQRHIGLERGVLVTRTPVRGAPGLQEVERLHAAAIGAPSTGAFLSRHVPSRLAELFPHDPADSSTWQAAVGARLDRRPRPRATLLLHEPVGGAQVAVVSQDTRAVAEQMTGLFKRMGVRDQRPTTLQRLTGILGRTNPRGLLSLSRPSDSLVGAQLLSFSLSEVLGEGAVLAPLEGGLYQTFTGADFGDGDPYGAMTLGAALERGTLKLAVGYAATRDPLEAAADGAVLRGELADRLQRCVQVLELASHGERLGGVVARDLLSELLWAAIVDAGQGVEVGQHLTGGQPLDVQVSTVVLLPREHPVAQRPPGLKLWGAGGVLVREVDEQLLQQVLLGG